MNRIRLFATATLMALTFNACDEGEVVPPPPPPTPVGTISGTVTIEGAGASGISAALSSGATTTTGAGGSFSFTGVEAGSYTVTISGAPDDVTFPNSTQAATIASDGQTVTLNFDGQYIRSSSVAGSVMAEGDELSGVTVTLDGENAMSDPQSTGMDGGFAFSGLRAGSYTVTISGFPEDVEFPGMMATESMTVDVGVGDVGEAMFDGAYIRTAGIEGTVSVEGEGFVGMTVTLAGGPEDVDPEMTGPDGQYSFESLRVGDYTVTISGYDEDDYEFESTSREVDLALGETETISFTGVQLRTSGITGRVSVEGMGLPNITVTLSAAGMDDKTTATDAGGTYAFGGLAAGDYTVAISVESDAYVFASMSWSGSVADDQNEIVNFEGSHDRSAMISGKLFIDEATKNNMYDSGEDAFPSPAMLAALQAAGVALPPMLPAPVTLVGPAVSEVRSGSLNVLTGMVEFAGLRAGTYQLQVGSLAALVAALPAQVAAVLQDYAYGGEPAGYEITVEAGEAFTQGLPVDITHTTVHFGVTLRSGAETGDALPGATVTLSSGESGTTGSNGEPASIRFARAGKSGNMVNATVAVDGYHVADGMTAVAWNPQKSYAQAMNTNDIVNLNVNVNVSGATVMTDYGGGEALAGWAIDVMMDDAAVEGAPTMLNSDGSAAVTTTVASVPASFTFSVADDQDDELDGGEMYEGSDGMYTHDGLSLAGAMDADPIEVRYTTQTLKVYVHHERDQVRGFTGNVLDGDVRMSGLVDLEVRQASGSGGRFTNPISNDDWDARANTSDSKGVYTFAHLPADMDIVVRADAAMDGYKLLDLERLDTYRNMDENGVMGGAFGAMGGWGHTVALCPLEEIEPTGQDFGDCASFGVVSLHNVSGLVWKRSVATSGTGFKITDPKFESGIEVSLDPVDGKNLAGVGGEFTTTSSNDATTSFDDTHQFDFGNMAAGAYELDVSDGWRVMLGDKGSDVPLGTALNPLGADVTLDVTPMTTTLYGFVRDHQTGFGLKGVPVEVSGQTDTTDDLGRYIVSGIPDANGKVNVSIARDGYPTTKESTAFVANMPTQLDIILSGANNTVAITGTVTESGTGTPLKGVEILVDDEAPLNASGGKLTTGDDGSYSALVATQPNNQPLVYVSPKKAGYHFIPEESPVAAIAGANPSANFTGYEATEIVGRVTAPGGGMPRSEVTVTAYENSNFTGALDDVTTTETGTFSVKVPTLSGTVYLKAEPRDDYDPTDANFLNLRDAERYTWFDPPATRSGGSIAVIPGQTLQFGTFTGNSVQPRIASVKRVTIVDAYEGEPNGRPTVIVPRAADRGGNAADEFLLVQGEPTDTVVVTWHYETRNDYNPDDLPGSTYSAQNVDGTDVGTGPGLTTATRTTFSAPTGGVTTPVSAIRGTRTRALPAGTRDRDGASPGTTVKHDRITRYILPEDDDDDYRAIGVKIGHAVVDADGDARANTAAVSTAAELAGVSAGASGVTVDRDYEAGVAPAVVSDSIEASWFGPGSPQLEQRIALEVVVETTRGGTTVSGWEWVVFQGGAITQPAITRDTDPNTDSGPTKWGKWNSAKFELNVATNAAADAWRDDDNANLAYTVSLTNLRAVRNLRIDTRVDNAGTWAKGTPVAVPPPS